MQDIKGGTITNEELIRRIRAGDNSALTSFMLNNEGLCGYVAKKYLKTGIDYDELISIAKVAMMKSVQGFKEEKGCKFVTYAVKYMCSDIIKYYTRRVKKWEKEGHLDEPIAFDDHGVPITKLDLMSDPRQDFTLEIEYREIIALLGETMKDLEPKLATVLELKYYKGMNQTEIGKVLGCSQAQVSRFERKALNKIKVVFDRHNVV